MCLHDLGKVAQLAISMPEQNMDVDGTTTIAASRAATCLVALFGQLPLAILELQPQAVVDDDALAVLVLEDLLVPLLARLRPCRGCASQPSSDQVRQAMGKVQCLRRCKMKTWAELLGQVAPTTQAW